MLHKHLYCNLNWIECQLSKQWSNDYHQLYNITNTRPTSPYASHKFQMKILLFIFFLHPSNIKPKKCRFVGQFLFSIIAKFLSSLSIFFPLTLMIWKSMCIVWWCNEPIMPLSDPMFDICIFHFIARFHVYILSENLNDFLGE